MIYNLLIPQDYSKMHSKGMNLEFLLWAHSNCAGFLAFWQTLSDAWSSENVMSTLIDKLGLYLLGLQSLMKIYSGLQIISMLVNNRTFTITRNIDEYL